MSEDSKRAPQWQPPNHLRDPFVRRFPQQRALWARASRGRIPDLREQAVAARLAEYANKDGSNAHPGAERLAVDCCTSAKTVRRALSWLIENGWVSTSHRGNRRLGHADVYQLTVPAPVAAELGWWPDEEQWMERPKGEPKRPELQRGTRPFPVANSVHRSARSVDNQAPSLDNGDGSVANVDQPPGLPHQGLSAPSRDSISASSSDDAATDPDSFEAIVGEIEERLGGPMSPTVATMVDAMLADGAHRKMIVRTALARERDGVA